MPPARNARHAHISGRFDCNPRAFARYVKDVVTRGRCTSFTTTETYGSLKPMRWHLDDWIITRRGEYVIGVRRDTYRRTKWTSFSRLSWVYAGRDGWKDLAVHRRTFVHRDTGREVLFVGFHSPKIEYGDVLQKQAAKAGYANLGAACHTAEQRRPGLVIVAGGDLNGNHHVPEMRAYFEATIGMDSCWTERRPAGGTHGDRLIDAIYSNVPMGASRISQAKAPPKLDHRACLTTLDLPAT